MAMICWKVSGIRNRPDLGVRREFYIGELNGRRKFRDRPERSPGRVKGFDDYGVPKWVDRLVFLLASSAEELWLGILCVVGFAFLHVAVATLRRDLASSIVSLLRLLGAY